MENSHSDLGIKNMDNMVMDMGSGGAGGTL